MKIVEKAIKQTYRFSCPVCGSRLEGTAIEKFVRGAYQLDYKLIYEFDGDRITVKNWTKRRNRKIALRGSIPWGITVYHLVFSYFCAKFTWLFMKGA